MQARDLVAYAEKLKGEARARLLTYLATEVAFRGRVKSARSIAARIAIPSHRWVPAETIRAAQFIYRTDPAHYLDEIIDPLGRTGVRSDYDEQGRLTTLVDAAGNVVGIAHDPDQSMETVTDALGNITVYI